MLESMLRFRQARARALGVVRSRDIAQVLNRRWQLKERPVSDYHIYRSALDCPLITGPPNTFTAMMAPARILVKSRGKSKQIRYYSPLIINAEIC